MSLVVAALAAFTLDTAAADQPTSMAPVEASNPVAPATTGKEPKERLICHTEPVTGSHFSRRVCETQEAANKRREEAREELERAKTQGALRVAPDFSTPP